MRWDRVAVEAMTSLFQAAILGVTAYAVFWLGHSGWWFLPAIFLIGCFRKAEDVTDGEPTKRKVDNG